MEQVSTNSFEDKKERNSSFEILRIIAIVFIIAHHFSVHGAFDFSELGNSALVLVNRTWIDFIAQLGKAGVNLFILISAYFLIDNNRFKTKKILYIITEMLFFSLAIGLTFFFVDKRDFSPSLIGSIFFPFGNKTWWFMTTYILLYIFSPLLNLGIKAMNRKMHLVLIIILIVIWSLLPTFLYLDYGYSNFGWFLTLYLIASYCRIYDISIKVKPFIGILISTGVFIIWFLIKCAIALSFDNNNSITTGIIGWFNLININNSIQVVTTLILFLSFKNIKMKKNKVINIVSSTTLAIYLLHDHDDIRHFLWIDLFKNATYSSSPSLIPYSIGVILGVFVIGVIVGLFYRYSIGFGVNRLLSVLDRKCLYKLDNVFNQNNTQIK